MTHTDTPARPSPTGLDPTPPTRRPLRVAYIVSRFPRLTETFVVEEAHAVRRAGADLRLYPLHRERASTVQPAAEQLAPHVRYHRLLSASVLASQWRALWRRPRTYLACAGSVIRHNWGSRRLLVGALAAFPLAVHLAREVQRDEVDHLHAHFATHPAVVAYVIHRLTGVPFSFTAHGSDLHRDRHMLAEKVRLAAFVVAVSSYNREVIIDECGAEVADRVVVVHCGVDQESFAPRTPGPPHGGPLRVCCIGTLHEVKGQSLLIEACARLRTQGVPVELTLVGDGPDRQRLSEQTERPDQVVFAGALTRPEVRAVLERSDVLVAPSVPTADGRREGLPVVLLEAMAVGVPVVASRLSGIPEAVIDGQTGLLVEPGDVDGLASAMGRLARDPALGESLSDRARAHLAQEFDLDRSARRLVAYFTGATT